MTKFYEAVEYVKADPHAGTKAVAKELGCSRRTIRRAKAYVKTVKRGKVPKILMFDIETSPMEVYVWGLWKQKISIQNVMEDWIVLMWAGKWLCDSRTFGERITVEEVLAKNDERIVRAIWKVLDEADIVVAHNAWGFDVRKLNARFLYYKMTPPSPYQVIDTYKAARKQFNLSSYKLDYLNQYLNLDEKKDPQSFTLWKRVMKGEEKAIREMYAYNVQDVAALEDLYLALRPWIKSHPNLGLYMDMDEPVCSNCGSNDLWWNSMYYTPAGKYKACKCKACGAIGRMRYTAVDKEKRKSLIIGVAR
jgi:DNA polymerase elongation subunit (family B)